MAALILESEASHTCEIYTINFASDTPHGAALSGVEVKCTTPNAEPSTVECYALARTTRVKVGEPVVVTGRPTDRPVQTKEIKIRYKCPHGARMVFSGISTMSITMMLMEAGAGTHNTTQHSKPKKPTAAFSKQSQSGGFSRFQTVVR